MSKGFWLAMALLWSAASSGKEAGRVLIVQDEKPAMQILSTWLAAQGVAAELVDQKSIPANLRAYKAVLVYIHLDIDEAAARQLIAYTNAGGRLVPLHHTISSDKLRNSVWLDFLGVRLPGGGTPVTKEPTQVGGHYAWRHGITQAIVNINPKHYITSHDVSWPDNTEFTSATFPSYSAQTETYINHYYTDGKAKTALLGFKYLDDRDGMLWMQTTAGWEKAAGKGRIVYLQPGHYEEEFRNPVLAQMILNAVNWQP